VKRSGRDEPRWVIIHMCVETTQRLSLYKYPISCFSYYLLCFFFNKIGEQEQILLGDGGGVWNKRKLKK
jgi:hypothetical protein